MKGMLNFEYKGRYFEIPYSDVAYGAGNCLYLIDKKKCIHVIYFENGKWVPLWHERFSSDFKDVLDWVIKQDLGNK